MKLGRLIRAIGCAVAAVLLLTAQYPGTHDPTSFMAQAPGIMPLPPVPPPQQAPQADSETRKEIVLLNATMQQVLQLIGEMRSDISQIQAPVATNEQPSGNDIGQSVAHPFLLPVAALIVAILIMLMMWLVSLSYRSQLQGTEKALALLDELTNDMKGIKAKLENLGHNTGPAQADAAAAAAHHVTNLAIGPIDRLLRDLRDSQPAEIARGVQPEFARIRSLLETISQQLRERPVAAPAALPRSLSFTDAAGSRQPAASVPPAVEMDAGAGGHPRTLPQQVALQSPARRGGSDPPSGTRPATLPALMAPAPPAIPDGLLSDYNTVLGDFAQLAEFKRRFDGIWVNRSGGLLVANDQEPDANIADGFLFVRGARVDRNATQARGFLVPGLNFFKRRSALNDPILLREVFHGIFKVEETSQDRLVSPAMAALSGTNVEVLKEGEIQFAR